MKVVKINDSQVIGANVAASNGVIHVTNKVLLPPSETAGSARFGTAENEIIAYPNPAIDRLTINPLQNQLSNNTNVVIYHAEGKVYYEGQMSKESNGQLNINVANYPRGLYLIKLQSGSENKTIRLYKK